MSSKDKACKEDSAPSSRVLLWATMAIYGVCSASMLILNKWALLWLPLPATLTFLQCAITVAVVLLGRATGAVRVETVSRAELRLFITAPFATAACLYTSNHLLKFSNAGLQILVRSTTPIAVCLMDYLVMGYERPSLRSIAVLVGLIVGAVGYFKVESKVLLPTIVWACLYWLATVFASIWIKHVVGNVPMSTWTRVLITNCVTAALMLPTAFAAREHEALYKLVASEHAPNPLALLAVGCSCLGGVCLAYTGFRLVASVSATTFALVNVLCKVGTVLVNQVIWEHHGTTPGALILLASLAFGAAYEEPVRRPPSAGAQGPDDREGESLLAGKAGSEGAAQGLLLAQPRARAAELDSISERLRALEADGADSDDDDGGAAAGRAARSR